MLRIKYCLLLALAAGLVAIPCAPSWAEDKEAKEGEAVEATPEDLLIDDLAAAYTMVRLGREKKMPEALISAARIIGTTPTRDFADDVKIDATRSKGDDPQKQALALLDEAVKMAGGRAGEEAIKALADAARPDIKEAKRGAVAGPQRRAGTVSSTDRDTFNIPFRGGRDGRIVITNPHVLPNRIINVKVFRPGAAAPFANRNLNRLQNTSVTFSVPKTGTFRIVVSRVTGPGELPYVILTN